MGQQQGIAGRAGVNDEDIGGNTDAWCGKETVGIPTEVRGGQETLVGEKGI